MIAETVCDRWAKTQAIIAANPRQRHRILGIRQYLPVDAATHIISVNCRTGERTVDTLQPRDTYAMSRPALRDLVNRVVSAHLEMKEYLALQAKLNRPKEAGPSTDKIIAAVARAANLSASDIFGGPSFYRGVSVIHARHLYCYLVAALRPDLSYPAIAKTFIKGRHHTTIMHAVASFPAKRASNPAVIALCAHRAVAAMVEKADRHPRKHR